MKSERVESLVRERELKASFVGALVARSRERVLHFTAQSTAKVISGKREDIYLMNRNVNRHNNAYKYTHIYIKVYIIQSLTQANQDTSD